MLKMIISAFRKGATDQQNAHYTASLIQKLESMGLSLEMAVGCYKGVRETSVIATGWNGVISMIDNARQLRSMYDQECVYVSIDGQAKLVYDRLHNDKRIGKELILDIDSFGPRGLENYTEMFDGSILYTV